MLVTCLMHFVMLLPHNIYILMNIINIIIIIIINLT